MVRSCVRHLGFKYLLLIVYLALLHVARLLGFR